MNITFILLMLDLFLRNESIHDPVVVKKGDRFQIILNENPSTGYSNCWINAGKTKVVKFLQKDYKPDSSQLIGAGGLASFVFEGVSKGKYELKFSNCPTGQNEKDCSFFSESNTAADTTIVVKVE